MFVITRFVYSKFPRRLYGRLGGGLNPSHPISLMVIVKLYVIWDVGRQTAVAELGRDDKLEDGVKQSVTSIRGGFEESVTI